MTATLGRWRATYTPGEWVVLSGPTALVVLEPPSREWAALINTLWDQVVASSSITDLASLLATFKMDQLPTFGAFFWTADGMRSLVRGQISVIDLATGRSWPTGTESDLGEVGLAGVEQVRVDLARRRCHPARTAAWSARYALRQWYWMRPKVFRSGLHKGRRQ
jgi:hypothetical protein